MRKLVSGVLSCLLLVLALAACGGAGKTRSGRTVVFHGSGSFPPSTVVGTYSAAGCATDSRTLVRDARLYYRHSTGAPAPADLYYYDMRFAYVHFQADNCTSAELGEAMSRGLTPRQRRYLLGNVAHNLQQAFRAALNAG